MRLPWAAPTIRARLTAWYALALTAMMVVYATATFIAVRHEFLEGSLDYVATGLPQTDDVIDGRRYLDNASPWSFSLVFVLPVAPM
jgi:hypothetical protein